MSRASSEAEEDVPSIPDPLLFDDLGALGSWNVSSWKPGHEIETVQDGSIDTYWQSDGPQPHYIHIHFPRLVTIRTIAIFLSPEEDESYCPQTIKVFCGMGHHTLLELMTLQCDDSKGWRHWDLRESWSNEGREFQTRLLQLRVVANRLNGKDTRIRAIKLLMPKAAPHVVIDGIEFRTGMRQGGRDPFSEEMLIR